MPLLDQHWLQPVESTLHTAYREVGDMAHHPLVHAIEQPIDNLVGGGLEIAAGAYHATHGLFRALPTAVAVWLGWTFVGAYFPRQRRVLEDGIDSVAKRMRLR